MPGPQFPKIALEVGDSRQVVRRMCLLALRLTEHIAASHEWCPQRSLDDPVCPHGYAISLGRYLVSGSDACLLDAAIRDIAQPHYRDPWAVIRVRTPVLPDGVGRRATAKALVSLGPCFDPAVASEMKQAGGNIPPAFFLSEL